MKRNRWGKKSRPKGEVYKRLNKDAVRSASNMPQGAYRRVTIADSIPSSASTGSCEVTMELTNTIMERVRRGEIKGDEAKEIERKAKSLAPAYNKGAYQYVGSVDAARDAGHKGTRGER